MNDNGIEGTHDIHGSAKPPVGGGGATDAPATAESPLLDLTVQRLIGIILVAVSLCGTVVLSAWLHPDPYREVLYSTGRMIAHSVYAGLVALFIWSLLRRWRRVAYLLIFGLVLAGIVTYNGAASYRANQERIAANEILLALREGWRAAEDLTDRERGNAYVDAFLGMRELYWELHSRADARMAPYRGLYDKYTLDGGFLDTKRLGSTYDLWYSYFQIHDLEHRLEQAKDSEIKVADLLWTINLLDVDQAARAAYAADLRTVADVISEAQADSIARERKTLRQMKRSLEVLIDADGYFHLDGSQIVFDRPEDAARFAGKADQQAAP